jgi:hypothetical protein
MHARVWIGYRNGRLEIRSQDGMVLFHRPKKPGQSEKDAIRDVQGELRAQGVGVEGDGDPKN